MDYYRLLVLIICINLTQGCGIQCSASPPIYNSYPGCVCPLKKYPYTFPAGSAAVDLIYQTNGQNVAANIMQNGIIIDSCSLTKSCVKRNVQLNKNLPYTITLTRSTDKNKNGAWLNSFEINPRDAQETGEVFLNPPELNVETEDQDGFIDAGIVYNYTFPVDDSIWLDMEFDIGANVTISILQNDSVVALYNNSYIYEQVNLSSVYDSYTISIFSQRNSGIKRMNVDSNSNDVDDVENNNSSNNESSILIGILTLTTVNFLFIVVTIIFAHRYSKKNSKSTNYLDMP